MNLETAIDPACAIRAEAQRSASQVHYRKGTRVNVTWKYVNSEKPLKFPGTVRACRRSMFCEVVEVELCCGRRVRVDAARVSKAR